VRVSIIGTGYVGLVSGVGLAAVGHDVTCVDIDEAKVDLINKGVPPIYEDGLEELLGQLVGRRLRAVTDLATAVRDTDLTLIAVGTPFDGERIGLGYIETAARQIGEALADKGSYHVVVVKSTVVPGTTEKVVLPILEAASGLQAGPDFGVGMNPEFLREGDALTDFMHPDRIVLGGIDGRTHDALAELYQPFDGTETLRTTPSTAEMIKYTANSLLATLISFSNEIANLSAEVGVDATEVMRGVHLDKRFTPILEDGTRIWPGATTYLEGGCGFGGSCFPKDVKALIAYGDEHGSPMDILRAVIGVNETQPQRMLELLERHLPDLPDRTVTVLGMAFKPGTDDIRESPSLPVTRELLARGALVTVHDPIARDEVAKIFGDRVRYADDLQSAVDGADAILLMTRWEQYRRLPELLAGRPEQPVVVDGRRLLARDSVARYEGIGRP
jgi:UDPglucose 6-dehydrogenase